MSPRKWIVICLVLVFALNLANCAPRQAHPQEASTAPQLPYAGELQTALDQALDAGQGQYDLGISAALIVPGYQPWLGTSGNSHAGVPVTPDMLFDTGSIAKNFEAALVLKLAQDGLLDLDDPLSVWLPPYPNVDRDITIRQLLNHTSGIFDVVEHPEFPWVGSDIDFAKRWTIEQVFDAFVLEPYAPPGEGQHYANTNYLLVTAIIEKVTGNTVQEELESRFLAPLKLDHIYVSQGEPLPERFQLAHSWIESNQAGVLQDISSKPVTWKATLTHPVIYATAEDLARWMQALYLDQSLLRTSYMGEMLTYLETTFNDPDMPGVGKYGLGVVDFTGFLGIPAIGHGGSTYGYTAAALYLPEHRATLVWMINTGESPRELADAMMGSTWASLSNVLPKQETSQPVKGSKPLLKKFVNGG
jgi:D-alanyl-D-alanine carboxypeptidase